LTSTVVLQLLLHFKILRDDMQVPFLLFSRKLPVATAKHGAKVGSAMIPSASIMANSEVNY
jgi:hypothetical protein